MITTMVTSDFLEIRRCYIVSREVVSRPDLPGRKQLTTTQNQILLGPKEMYRGRSPLKISQDCEVVNVLPSTVAPISPGCIISAGMSLCYILPQSSLLCVHSAIQIRILLPSVLQAKVP